MKNSLKRILSVILVLVMSMALLAGCGSSNNGKNKGNATNKANNNGTSTNNANNNGTATNNANNNGTSTNNANNNGNSNGNTGAKAGTYTASAKGYSSDVKVTVTIGNDGSISDIKVDASGETAELGGKAAPKICDEVKSKQSLAVDTVTGATITSNATITALTDALSQAGADLGKLK